MKKKHKTDIEDFSTIVLDAFDWEDFIRSGELLTEQKEIDDLLSDLE